MRVVHLCKGVANGGFIAAWRIHQALLAQGVDSIMVVRERGGRDDLDLVAFDDSRLWWLWFRFRGMLSRMLHALLLGRGSIKEFYLQWIPTFIPWSIKRRLHPDILHVHAPDDGLWSLWELACWPRPIVWTFHAYRDFSQGYIYLAHRHQRWIDGGQCASIHDRDERLIPHVNLAIKKRLMAVRKDVCVSPSHFVHEAGKASGVFLMSRHQVIRNCVPLDYFHQTGRDEWRSRHEVADDEFVLLVGAHSLDYKIKGFDLFVECMSHHREQAKQLHLVIALFGSGKAPAVLAEIGRVIELGYLNEEGLRAAYSGADVFVIPSREDNFPNVIIEALACGLPYVGFDTGGVGDMIRENAACGVIAPAFDLELFFSGLCSLVSENSESRQTRRLSCREASAQFCDPSKIASEYHTVYKSIVL